MKFDTGAIIKRRYPGAETRPPEKHRDCPEREGEIQRQEHAAAAQPLCAGAEQPYQQVSAPLLTSLCASPLGQPAQDATFGQVFPGPGRTSLVAEARRRKFRDLMVKPDSVLCKLNVSLKALFLLYFSPWHLASECYVLSICFLLLECELREERDFVFLVLYSLPLSPQGCGTVPGA